MNRRLFLKNGLTAGIGTASLLALSSSKVLASEGVDLGADISEALTDNDGEPAEAGGRADFRSEGGIISAGSTRSLWNYETVIPYLSPFLESKFDVFFFVNTDTRGSSQEFVEYQHMKIIRRVAPGPLFTRDSKGVISGLTSNAQIWKYIGISSGKGSPYILTYSGIFRFNRELSISHFNPNPEGFMSFSMYMDFIYQGGRESHVAIHGTPSRNHHLLGKSRASEGCMRVLPTNAKSIRELLMSKEMFTSDLPEFNRYSQLPSRELMQGQVGNRPGIKALLITFNGYQVSSTEA